MMFVRGLWQDVRLSVTRLSAQPFSACFIIVTLALAIAAISGVYSLLDALLANSRGVASPSSVVVLRDIRSNSSSKIGVTLEEFDYLKTLPAFEHFVGWVPKRTALSANGRASTVTAESVTGEFFSTLGVKPAVGRLLQPADCRIGASPVAVLSNWLWRAEFGGREDAIGATVRLGGRLIEIVGIAPEFFSGLSLNGLLTPALWVPLQAGTASGADRTKMELWFGARLDAGAEMEEAQVQVRVLAGRLDTASPRLGTDARQSTWTLSRLSDRSRIGRSSFFEFVIIVVPFLVLMVAVSNLAQTVLYRGMARRAEFAVRQALGADRGAIVRQIVVEAALVALPGCVIGVWASRLLLDQCVRLLRGSIGVIPEFQLQATVQPVVTILVVTMGLATVVVAGVLPGLYFSRRSPLTDLKAESTGFSTTRWQWRKRLIALQVSVSSALLLVTAYCVVFAFGNERTTSVLSDVAVVSIPLELTGRSPSEIASIVSVLEDRVRTLPGAREASICRDLRETPGMRVRVSAPNRPLSKSSDGHTSGLTIATPLYFSTLALNRRAGRFFSDADRSDHAPVAVVSEKLARAVFGRVDAIDQELLVRTSDFTNSNWPIRIITVRIVGVTDDSDPNTFGLVKGMLYLPLSQNPVPNISILARPVSGSAALLAPAVSALVRSIDGNIPITFAGTGDRSGESVSTQVIGFVSYVLGGLGVLATVLSMLGLYGLMSASAEARQREMALRIALGAGRRTVIMLVLKEGLRPVLGGLVIGLGTGTIIRAILKAQFTSSMPAMDILPALAVAIPIVFVAIVACLAPSLRTARLQPSVVLRST